VKGSLKTVKVGGWKWWGEKLLRNYIFFCTRLNIDITKLIL